MLGGFTKSSKTEGLRPLGAEMRPEGAFYAIGDVHGCFEHMRDTLARIDDDIDAHGIDDPKVVFLGDYVDRGPRSSKVLDFLITLSANEPDAVICLKGNHEEMLLDFLDDPKGVGTRWLKYGGGETLESFGIETPTDFEDIEALYIASEELHDALPDGTEAWLRALPLQWRSGNIHCVHAAMDPARTPLDQDAKCLLWGHDRFLSEPREDANWVVHGHTIVDTPSSAHGRIAIDTGCYFTGRLTAAAFTGETCRFL